MKYTDRFFKFPIRLPDEEQAIEISNKFKEGKDISDIVLRSIDSMIRIPIIEDDIIYHETYPPEDNFEDLHKVGLTTTLVVSKEYGTFMCSWNIKKFEEELNKYMEKFNDNSSKDKEKV